MNVLYRFAIVLQRVSFESARSLLISRYTTVDFYLSVSHGCNTLTREGKPGSLDESYHYFSERSF